VPLAPRALRVCQAAPCSERAPPAMTTPTIHFRIRTSLAISPSPRLPPGRLPAPRRLRRVPCRSSRPLSSSRSRILSCAWAHPMLRHFLLPAASLQSNASYVGADASRREISSRTIRASSSDSRAASSIPAAMLLIRRSRVVNTGTLSTLVSGCFPACAASSAFRAPWTSSEPYLGGHRSRAARGTAFSGLTAPACAAGARLLLASRRRSTPSSRCSAASPAVPCCVPRQRC